jgi:CheY-like chemotaxis protein
VKVAGPHLLPPTQVTFDLQPLPRMLGDEPRLVQALVNVLVNAGQAVAGQAVAGQASGGQIHVFTGTDAGGRGFVTVRDDGPGVTDAHRARLGEPYFTTRAESGGLGLGLFVTRGIVDAHGGEWRVEAAVPRGTAVTLAFPGVPEAVQPVTPAAPASEATPAKPPVGPARIVPFPQPAAAERGPAPAEHDPARAEAGVTTGAAVESAAPVRPTLLLVDDEPLVVKMLATVLRRAWTVTVAQSGAEALVHLDAGRFDAIVCDLMMPGMSGIDLAGEIARRDPEQRGRMVFLTGGAVTAEAETFLERADVRYLTKPVPSKDLLAALDGLTTR